MNCSTPRLALASRLGCSDMPLQLYCLLLK